MERKLSYSQHGVHVPTVAVMLIASPPFTTVGTAKDLKVQLGPRPFYLVEKRVAPGRQGYRNDEGVASLQPKDIAQVEELGLAA